MAGRPKQTDLNAPIPVSGLQATKLEMAAPEIPEERKHRLRKDFLGFVCKDLAAYVLAYLILAVVVTFAGWTLSRAAAPKEDRQWAMSILTTLLVGIVGMAFGRASKS
jgi:hypothetical protein